MNFKNEFIPIYYIGKGTYFNKSKIYYIRKINKTGNYIYEINEYNNIEITGYVSSNEYVTLKEYRSKLIKDILE